MGILSTQSTSITVDSSTAPVAGGDGGGGGGAGGGDGGSGGEKSTATPTYLSGESLTFPLVAGVGTAALTIITAILKHTPGPILVFVVATVLGAIVTIWGFGETKGAAKPSRFQIFKYAIIGLLNTVLLAAALWGGVAVTNQTITNAPTSNSSPSDR